MSLKSFLLLFLFALVIPVLMCLVIPSVQSRTLAPVAYQTEVDGKSGFYPQNAAHERGAQIYAREGCAVCHTQQIRASWVGNDIWRRGWGKDQSETPKFATRPTIALDYYQERVSFLGERRIGPDLANFGYRDISRSDLHRLLYHPRFLNSTSVMPSYRHLYREVEQEASGPKDKGLLNVKGEPILPGMDVLPTPEAEDLVDYLLTLKRDEEVPGHAYRKED